MIHDWAFLIHIDLSFIPKHFMTYNIPVIDIKVADTTGPEY